MKLLLTFSVGCLGASEPSSVSILLDAMSLGETDLVAGFDTCDNSMGAARHDCYWAVAGLASKANAELALERCQALPPPASSECRFVLAESTEDADYCPEEVEWRKQCQLHLLLEDLPAQVAQNPLPSTTSSLIERHAADRSIVMWEDAWEAAYATLIDQRRPVSSESCSKLDGKGLQRCQSAVTRVFAGYVENARRTGALPCDGTLPHRFRDVTDPLLPTMFAEAAIAHCP